MFLFSPNTKTKKKLTGGFSLVELMVTIGIVTLVTGVVMVKYSAFNSVVILKSQAYELALDIREAQVFGVSVGGGTNSYRQAYGIYVDMTNPNQYLLFQDTSGDLQYDAGEEIGETYTIDSRFEIINICTVVGAGGDVCTATMASIAFKRPDFDAQMATNTEGSPDVVKVTIATTDDHTQSRTVLVYASGQISVQ